jgi:hypothetical protein
MSEHLGHGEHGPHHRDDVYNQRTEDQTEDSVEDVGPYRFYPRFEAQLGFPDVGLELGAKRGDVRLAGELGAPSSFL